MNRREFLGITASAGATLALTPELLRALQTSNGGLAQRAIPSSGEKLPVVSFAPRPTGPAVPGEIKSEDADVPAMKECLKTLLDNGGKVVDVLHGGPLREQGARTAANELGIQDKLFWTTPLSVRIPTLPGYDGPPLKVERTDVNAEMEAKFAKFKVSKIDLVMVGTNIDVPMHLAVLREMKKAGRVRYIGVHTLAFPAGSPQPFGDLESIMRDEQIDFVGTDYSVGDRRVEETILPLAVERKIAFMAYFPFDRNRIFKRASSTPLPEWAAEFDAKTWAQFFLKYVLSHPAVIVARTGTTKSAHMLDNIGGGIGRLPNEATRKRMAELIDSFPPTPPPGPPKPQQQKPQAPPVALSAAIQDRYVGEYVHVAANHVVTVRRDADKLLMKSGSAPEAPLIARSETRFAAPFEMIFEFQLDGQGKVTGAIVEQGPYRIPLVRK